MGERVLIMGGAGYIGGVLVPALLRSGYQVTVVDTFAHGVNTLASSCADPAFEAVRADARDEARMRHPSPRRIGSFPSRRWSGLRCANAIHLARPRSTATRSKC